MGRFKAHYDSINMTLLPCCYYVVSSESLDQEHINAITLDPDFLCSLSKLFFTIHLRTNISIAVARHKLYVNHQLL